MNIQVNDCVTILGHVGIIDDIAISEKGKTLILWRSLKGAWNHHPQEWIDITEHTVAHIRLATQDDIDKDILYYTKHCTQNQAEQMVTLHCQLYGNLSLADKGEISNE